MMEELDEELLCLPKEWTYTCPEVEVEKGIAEEDVTVRTEGHIDKESVEECLTKPMERVTQATDDNMIIKEKHVLAVKKRNKKWGPVIPKRRSKRNIQDGRTMIEKAQALKEKNNLEIPKGKKPVPTFSNKELVDIASKIGLDVDHKMDSSSSKAQQILDIVEDRNSTFTEGCKFVGCNFGYSSGELPPEKWCNDIHRDKNLIPVVVDVGKSTKNNSVEISQVDKMDFSSKEIMGVDLETPVEDIRASIDEEIDLEEQA